MLLNTENRLQNISLMKDCSNSTVHVLLLPLPCAKPWSGSIPWLDIYIPRILHEITTNHKNDVLIWVEKRLASNKLIVYIWGSVSWSTFRKMNAITVIALLLTG